MTSHFRCEKHSASCFAVCRCGKVQALLFCIVLRCLLEGSSFIILHRASLFVGRFKLYYSASCFAVCWKVQALLFCTVLRCLLEGSSFIILHRASLFVGRFKLYCCLVGKLFCYVVKKFRRCNLSKPEESVCHFWTLYINQNVFCFERFAMFDRTDPLWSQIKSAK